MNGRAEEFIQSPEETAVGLAVSPLPADRARLREILSQGNWKLYEASDCCEALAMLRDRSVAVLPCERDHADGNWEDLLKAAVRVRAPPNFIVFSRLADESLWAKVLNLGGFDLLMTPLEPEEVWRITLAAWNRWERDFVSNTAKGATRTGNSAAVQPAPQEDGRLWAERERETRSSAAAADGLYEPGVR